MRCAHSSRVKLGSTDILLGCTQKRISTIPIDLVMHLVTATESHLDKNRWSMQLYSTKCVLPYVTVANWPGSILNEERRSAWGYIHYSSNPGVCRVSVRDSTSSQSQV